MRDLLLTASTDIYLSDSRLSRIKQTESMRESFEQMTKAAELMASNVFELLQLLRNVFDGLSKLNRNASSARSSVEELRGASVTVELQVNALLDDLKQNMGGIRELFDNQDSKNMKANSESIAKTIVISDGETSNIPAFTKRARELNQLIGDVLSHNIDVAELLGRIEKLLPNIKTDPRLRTCRDMQLLSLTCSRYVGPKLSILSFIDYEELKEASSCVQKDAGELFILFGKFFECVTTASPRPQRASCGDGHSIQRS